MDRSGLTSIGRPLDLRYPSNRFAAAAALLTGAAWAGWELAARGGVGASAGRGAVAGAAVFLAWALGRELDPDRAWTAGLAAVVTAGLAGVWRPSLLVLGAGLLAARVSARSTGRAPGPVDLAAVVGLAWWVSVSGPGLPFGLAMAAALAADRFLPGPAPVATLWAGGAAAAGAIAAAVIWATLTPGWPEWPEAWLIAPAILGLIVPLRPRQVASVGDLTGLPLEARRVRFGRWLVAAAGWLAAIGAGGAGLAAAAPVWAALTAAGLPSRKGGWWGGGGRRGREERP
jgi:hypothetical protein